MRTLSPVDAQFVHLNTRSGGMAWGLFVCLSPGPSFRLDELRARVAERCIEQPLFRGVSRREGRRVVLADAGLPDVSAHVRLAAPGEDALAPSLTAPLPAGGPAWDLVLFPGPPQALLLRVHHSLADGIVGALFADLFLDRVGPSPLARYGLDGGGDIEVDPPITLAGVRALLGGPRGARGPEWRRSGMSAQREVAMAVLPAVALRKQQRTTGATANALVLATVAAAAQDHPGFASSRRPRTLVPVTLDAGARHQGNRVVAGIVALPVGLTHQGLPVTEATQVLNALAEAGPHAGPALARIASRMPWGAQGPLVRATAGIMRPQVHVGVLPGFLPIQRVLGRAVDSAVPLSPLFPNMRLSVTVLLIRQHLTVGVVGRPGPLSGLADRVADRFASEWDGERTYA
ncbi:MAG: wax ester/triacylglycerol synthase family O-acyltransferase [Actinobacteria bacterium]|nr:wax ester/triacylglycerol synthase family O-acyltransferase [Actinomycetota bacterium]